MSDWNSELYAKFEAQRTIPAKDLAAKISAENPERIIDIGCGPGNSTAVLKGVFPHSHIIGADSSPDMIKRARQNHPQLSFELCQAREIDSGYDVIFSNACLQWVDNHSELLPQLMDKLNAGGILAVQMPRNGDEPLYRLIDKTVHDESYGFAPSLHEQNIKLPPERYFEILSGCSRDFDIWETVYYHRMPSHRALLDWVKSTRLRPYLKALDDAGKEKFESELLSQTKKLYKTEINGEIIFRFRRLFFTAKK